MSLHDNTETHRNHHYIILCIVMNDLAYILRADFTHKNIIICACTIYTNPFFTIAATKNVTLQISLPIKHYKLSLHASSLCSIMSFPPGCLLFGFRFTCVCVAFGLVLLFTVAFGTPYAVGHTFHTIAISLG